MCGIVGTYHKRGTPLSMMGALILNLLQPIQNRGKESAGSSVATGNDIKTQKGFGRVLEAISAYTARRIDGISGIGQVRYSNTGAKISKKERLSITDPETTEAVHRTRDCQPIWFTVRGKKYSIVHNGNLLNTVQRRGELKELGWKFRTNVDTEVIAIDIASNLEKGFSEEQAIRSMMETCVGAYSCILLCEDGTLYGWRDPRGFWPLIIGQNEDLYFLSSEDTSWHRLGGKNMRSIKRAEIIRIDEDGIFSYGQPEKLPPPARCCFGRVYIQRAMAGLFSEESNAANLHNVSMYRIGQGSTTFTEVQTRHKNLLPGLIIPMMDSGYDYAFGFAVEHAKLFGQHSNLCIIYPKDEGAGRSFQETTDEERKETLHEKTFDNWLAYKGVVYATYNEHGKVGLYVVDDSSVRGITTEEITEKIREDLKLHFPDIPIEAFEIHWVICSPPIRYPCPYGLDTPTFDELWAHGKTVEEMNQLISADSITYLSYEGFKDGFGPMKKNYCDACMTGEYPIDPYEHGYFT